MIKKRINVSDYWGYLKEAGINRLTSEACGVSMRALCDVNAVGEVFLNEVFGGIQLQRDGWNKQSGKSIMLFNTMLKSLVIFHLLYEGYQIVIDIDGHESVTAYLNAEDYDAEYNKLLTSYSGKFRTYHNSGTAGLRNRHEMSGRIS